MAEITRRFDGNSTEIDLFAVLFHEIEGLERVFDPGIEIGKNVHRSNLREGLLFVSAIMTGWLRDRPLPYRKSGVWSNSRWWARSA